MNKILIDEIKQFADEHYTFEREIFRPSVKDNSDTAEVHKLCVKYVEMFQDFARKMVIMGFSKNQVYYAIKKLRGNILTNDDYLKYDDVLIGLQVQTKGTKIWGGEYI